MPFPFVLLGGRMSESQWRMEGALQKDSVGNTRRCACQ